MSSSLTFSYIFVTFWTYLLIQISAVSKSLILWKYSTWTCLHSSPINFDKIVDILQAELFRIPFIINYIANTITINLNCPTFQPLILTKLVHKRQYMAILSTNMANLFSNSNHYQKDIWMLSLWFVSLAWSPPIYKISTPIVYIT